MEYEAGDILDQTSSTADLEYPFSVPTALDGMPSSQFFPVPKSPALNFGCPMGLFVILSPDDLIAEVLHPWLTYKRENIVKVGAITAGLPEVDFRQMRNAHLWALRIEANQDNYGVEL
jgi:hypothetical protein